METIEQVKEAVSKAGIDFIPHHACGICGEVVGYVIEDGNLFFDSTCGCSSYQSPLRPVDWLDSSFLRCLTAAIDAPTGEGEK